MNDPVFAEAVFMFANFVKTIMFKISREVALLCFASSVNQIKSLQFIKSPDSPFVIIGKPSKIKTVLFGKKSQMWVGLVL